MAVVTKKFRLNSVFKAFTLANSHLHNKIKRKEFLEVNKRALQVRTREKWKDSAKLAGAKKGKSPNERARFKIK